MCAAKNGMKPGLRIVKTTGHTTPHTDRFDYHVRKIRLSLPRPTESCGYKRLLDPSATTPPRSPQQVIKWVIPRHSSGRQLPTNLMLIQPLDDDCSSSPPVVAHFFAKRQGSGEKGVDASKADPHNSPAQLNRVLFNGEKCWLCSSVG